MANTIAHLAVAKELINHKNDLIENEKAFYLGVLAPDTIAGKKDATKADKKRVHLLTDKCNHMTMRQKLLLKAYERDLTSSDREFYLMCVNDLEALDAYLLEKYPELGGLFEEIRAEGALWCLPGMIEKEYIEDFIPFSVHWILDELEQLLR